MGYDLSMRCKRQIYFFHSYVHDNEWFTHSLVLLNTISTSDVGVLCECSVSTNHSSGSVLWTMTMVRLGKTNVPLVQHFLYFRLCLLILVLSGAPLWTVCLSPHLPIGSLTASFLFYFKSRQNFLLKITCWNSNIVEGLFFYWSCLHYHV